MKLCSYDEKLLSKAVFPLSALTTKALLSKISGVFGPSDDDFLLKNDDILLAL